MSFKINKAWTAYPSKNKVSETFDTKEEAQASLRMSLESIRYGGGEILKEEADSFTFINNDNDNSEITYYITE